jgi:predicted porin
MKKLIPAALLLAAFGAHAQATVYGLIDMSYGKNIFDSASGAKADFHSGGDGGSGQGNSATRIGIKGSNDVGSGLKLNFKLETNGITSDPDVPPPFFGRAAYLGLSGSFGEVRLGRQDSVQFQTMIDFDFNGAANNASAYAASGVAAWSLRGRQSRSLQYISNEMAGFKVQVGFVPEGNVPNAKATYSAGLTYTLDKLVVAVATETKRTSDSTDAFVGKGFSSLAARYDLGVVKVAATYANGGEGLKGFGVGVTGTFAGTNVGLQVGKNSDTISNKATAIEVFANREILKNTYAYLDIGKLNKPTLATTSPTLAAKGTGFALGVIYTF